MGNAVSNNPHPLREIFHDGSAQHATTTPSVEFDGINRSRQTVTTSIVRNKLETKHFPLSVIVDQSTQTSNTAYSEKKNASPRPFKKSCIILFCIYLAICIFLCTSGSLQSVLVYLHIIRFPFGDLKNLQRFGLSNARNVNFTTEDGILLHGYHLVPMVGIRNHKKRVSEWDSSDFDYSLAHAERIVIFFHGNGATRAYSNRIDIIKQLTTVLDAHVITFDYRGFGDSTGWPSEHGTLLDARAVTKWLHSVVTKHNLHSEGYCPEKKSFLSNLLGKKKSLERSAIDDRSGGATPQLILYGHSLGTAISTAITAELNQLAPRAVSGLILDSPFSSLMEAIESHPVAVLFRFFPLLKRIISYAVRFKYDTLNLLPSVGTNVLLIHGKNDYKVLPSNSLKLFQAALASGFSPMEGFSSNCSDHSVRNSSEVNSIQLVIVPNAGHDDSFKSKAWFDHVPRFVDRTMC